MELHLLLGVVNGLYDHLDKILKNNSFTISASDWSVPLGLIHLAYYGGQFNGNQCKKLLLSTDRLEQILRMAGTYHVAMPILDTFLAFNEVRKACFGVLLDKEHFRVHIRRFAEAYQILGLSITPKLHAIFVHVPQFLQHQNLVKGLGFWSEQASETVHRDFDDLWVEGRYKRALGHTEYSNQLFKCVVTYNSRHL